MARIRIIAGEARGRRLRGPDDRQVRPTSDRVREALFSILAGRVPGGRFLDLFAGTGANGLEAWSRGAARVVLVDNSTASMSIIRENVRTMGMTGDLRCIQADLPRDLARVDGHFDIIFADPPYRYEDYAPLLAGIGASDLLDAEGILCLEHNRKREVPPAVEGLALERQKTYGDTTLSFYGPPAS